MVCGSQTAWELVPFAPRLTAENETIEDAVGVAMIVSAQNLTEFEAETRYSLG